MPRLFLARTRLLALAALSAAWLLPAEADAGEAVCKVVADNAIASFDGNPDERTENVGNAKELKIKGIENQPILTFDLSPVPKDASISKAVLSVKLTGPEYAINQIGYSTVPTAWAEGTGATPDVKEHAFCCHRWPAAGKTWAGPGSDILDVIHGLGGNVNGWVLAKKVGERYEIELPGRVFEAIRADQPGGLLLMDESGRWAGKRSNIYFYSREAGADGPVLTVTWSDEKDAAKPSTPGFAVAEADLEDGGVLLEIACGGDDEAKGTALGFDIRLNKGGALDTAGWEKAQELPRYRIPRPKASGEKLRLWVQDLEPGAEYGFGIVAYDEAGNRSAAAFVKAKASGPTAPDLKSAPIPVATGGPRKIGGALQLWAADELTKIDPVSGKTLGGEGYADTKAAEGNAVWNGKDGTVVVEGARNEAVCFRLAVQKAGDADVTGITIAPGDFKSGGGAIEAKHVRLLREWYVKSENQYYGGPLPVLNEKDGGAFDVPAKDNAVPGQTVQTIFVEIQIPKDANPGHYQGALAVAAGDAKGELPVALIVHEAVLPDELSYVVELNAYGQGNKDDFYAIHRLAHRFRLGYNTLGYGHSGGTSLPFIPKINGEGAESAVADWSAWDDWMGPLLDGSAFKDLPRGEVPIPHFYLPFFENYPASVRTEYLGGKIHAARPKMSKEDWPFFMCQNDVFVADAFSDKWKAAAKKIAGDYVKHFEEKGWTRTEFQIFANNKVFKGGDKATALWCLDEPSFGRDFHAIAFLYRSFQDPFKGSKLRWTTRGDISRPEWQGDRLDGACETVVVSGAFYGHQDIIQRRRVEQGDKYWLYGGGGNLGADKDLAQLDAYYVKSWSLGTDGGLAYWTSFHGNQWDENDPLAIVVGAKNGYTTRATATGRLAAQRRAQQDVELLNLLSAKKGWSRRQVAHAVAKAINLEADTTTKGADDPGDIRFRAIDAAKLAQVRAAVYRLLDQKD